MTNVANNNSQSHLWFVRFSL